ncbi:L-threonylcarbamoyladenylate synthase [Motiliproteus sp. SC1-56]|uniref:L-threonylcarbamoyladenylate synthase n=1 Tax=Motiliproteus sp. SC1-56 TaxID=2799565 RepID=UPI001A8F71F7|nr:Sua5/YciO/YrdC/YwlC family protein [Motiliproteus sp. SC1-56]
MVKGGTRGRGVDRWRLKQATRALQAGGVIAYPTEAVWGLGCDPWNEAAFRRLLALKRRPPEKGVILIAADRSQIAPLLNELTPAQAQHLAASWPGPVTWLLPDPQDWVPAWIKGGHPTVAVRVSDHPLVAELCRAFGGPLVSTSANRAGHPPGRTPREVRLALGPGLDYLLPGALGGRERPSEIRDLRTLDTLRH